MTYQKLLVFVAGKLGAAVRMQYDIRLCLPLPEDCKKHLNQKLAIHPRATANTTILFKKYGDLFQQTLVVPGTLAGRSMTPIIINPDTGSADAALCLSDRRRVPS